MGGAVGGFFCDRCIGDGSAACSPRCGRRVLNPQPTCSRRCAALPARHGAPLAKMTGVAREGAHL
eukprot:11079663-Alexandrium_andersonii.AAC.1